MNGRELVEVVHRCPKCDKVVCVEQGFRPGSMQVIYSDRCKHLIPLVVVESVG